MASVNKVILVGNLGRDPEIRSFSNGDRVANVNLATTDRWKDKQSGEMREATEWHRIVFNGRLVDIVEQYLRKGSQVYVEGSLRTRKWQDRDGNDKYTTEIVIAGMGGTLTMLDGAPGGGGGSRGGDSWSQGGGSSGGWDQGGGSGGSAGGGGSGGWNQGSGGSSGGGRPPFDDDLDDDVPF